MKILSLKHYTLFLIIATLVLFSAILAFPYYVLKNSGEFVPVERVVDLQLANQNLVLYGPAFRNPAVYFKLVSVITRHPRIIALGTSRVMQFRSVFFKEGAQFYNAGGGIEKIKHFSHFLNHLPFDAQPGLIVVGLDQNFFNPVWDNLSEDDIETRLSADVDTNVLDITASGWLLTYAYYFEHKFQVSNLNINDNGQMLIGLNAIANKNGFRNDGSYFYGEYLHNKVSNEARFGIVLSQIESGTGSFPICKNISPAALNEVDKFLQNCKTRGIDVIGFLPPWAPEVYRQIASRPQYDYFWQIAPSLMPLFQSYGFRFYDFSDVKSLGASDEEFIDGSHGSEKVYLRLLLSMIKNDYGLGKYSLDVVELQHLLDTSQGNYFVSP